MNKPETPMTREELRALVEETLYSYAKLRSAVPWDIDNLMGAIEEHVQLRLTEAGIGEPKP